MNKQELKELLDKKRTVVSYKNKEKRTSFDETFGMGKMNTISKVIGDNPSLFLEKLKESEKKG